MTFPYKENDWITAEEHAFLKGYAPEGFHWVLLATFKEAAVRGMMFSTSHILTYVLRAKYHKDYKSFPYRLGDLLWLPRELSGNLLVNALPKCPIGLQWSLFTPDLVILIQCVTPYKIPQNPMYFQPCCVCQGPSDAICCNGSFGAPPHYACKTCACANGPSLKCPGYQCSAEFFAHNFVFDTPDIRVKVPCITCKKIGHIHPQDLHVLHTALELVRDSKDYGSEFKGVPPYGKNPMAFLWASIRAFVKNGAKNPLKVSTFFKVHVRDVLLGIYFECDACGARFCPMCRGTHTGKLCFE